MCIRDRAVGSVVYDVLWVSGPVCLSQVIREGGHLTGVFVLLLLLLFRLPLWYMENVRGAECIAGVASFLVEERGGAKHVAGAVSLLHVLLLEKSRGDEWVAGDTVNNQSEAKSNSRFQQKMRHVSRVWILKLFGARFLTPDVGFWLEYMLGCSGYADVSGVCGVWRACMLSLIHI